MFQLRTFFCFLPLARRKKTSRQVDVHRDAGTATTPSKLIQIVLQLYAISFGESELYRIDDGGRTHSLFWFNRCWCYRSPSIHLSSPWRPTLTHQSRRGAKGVWVPIGLVPQQQRKFSFAKLEVWIGVPRVELWYDVTFFTNPEAS